MKALLSKAPGPARTLVLEEIPDPTPGPGQVVIDVKACGVNFPDVLMIEDRYQVKPPRPFAPGIEVAGVVIALGPGTTGFALGQRVVANTRSGGMAEKAAINVALTTAIPDSIPFDEAAALVTTYGTSLYALDERSRLQPGETLLVLGAAGGVGLAGVELGHALGARVIAAASSQAKLDLALSRGADAGVVYPAGPFDKEGARALATLVKQACGDKGWDVCLDAIGGDYTEAAVRACGWNSRLLVVGFTAGIPRLPLNLVLLKSCAIVGVAWGSAIRHDPPINARVMNRLIALHGQGKIRPTISERYPLQRAGDAIARLADRSALGKLIVEMS